MTQKSSGLPPWSQKGESWHRRVMTQKSSGLPPWSLSHHLAFNRPDNFCPKWGLSELWSWTLPSRVGLLIIIWSIDYYKNQERNVAGPTQRYWKLECENSKVLEYHVNLHSTICTLGILGKFPLLYRSYFPLLQYKDGINSSHIPWNSRV